MTADLEFWNDGSPVGEYPYHDEVEVIPETEYDPAVPDSAPHSDVESTTDAFPSRYEFLEQVVEDIESSQSWHFLAANRKDEVLDFTAVSKGNIPLLTADDFPGIEEQVTVTSEDRETYSKMHVVRYVGDIVGLEMFVDYLTGDLDGKTEGDEDPIGDFRQRNPLWPLAVFGPKSE